MMGAGSASPVVSTISRSNCNSPVARRASRSLRAARNSPRTLQQTQPLLSSTTLTPEPPSSRAPSILAAPNSFSRMATEASPWWRRKWLSKVVLPAPRKPVSRVTATACVMLDIL
ncbi:hypothetical protein D3C85_1577080 [compost metagenome]